ncbi:MAG: hypothetical protein EOP83_01830 [Verrucomicrobiaceae bacterium]|nr:MAG: hypothetical protein EOP83_01830 [Verrucomicrobiaceae bacterium]
MKTGLLAFALCLLVLPANAAKPERSREEKLIIASLEKLPARMKLEFNIPFPKDWDIDAHSKQPIAIMEVDGGKVCITQPKMQPYDGHGTIEWMIGPDPERLIEENVECMLSLDEWGEFLSIVLISSGDDWPAENANHQISRRDAETGTAFFERAMLTYRLRSKKAKDPVFAARVITAIEKISNAAQQLRKEPPRK